jgi:hypothetical protein
MSLVWTNVRLLDAAGFQGRNAIVMAGPVETLCRPHLRIPPSAEADIIDAELAMMEFKK